MVSKTDQSDSIPPVVRGTLITIRRRCGKSTCRCVNGQAHESPALSVSLSGRSVTISLRPGEVPAVEAALARYRVAREELEAQANRGVQAMRTRHRPR
jgi:hypothetical protein